MLDIGFPYINIIIKYISLKKEKIMKENILTNKNQEKKSEQIFQQIFIQRGKIDDAQLNFNHN